MHILYTKKLSGKNIFPLRFLVCEDRRQPLHYREQNHILTAQSHILTVQALGKSTISKHIQLCLASLNISTELKTWRGHDNIEPCHILIKNQILQGYGKKHENIKEII